MTARNPTHPGATIRECMAEMGWSVQEFADKLEICPDTVAKLLKGHCGISAVVALALERLGWSDANFWMRLQANYDLAQARRELAAKAAAADAR